MIGMTGDDLIGMRLHHLRGGMAQAALAERMAERGHKWAQATVWSVERGKRPLRLSEAASVADILGVPVEALLSHGMTAKAIQELDAATAELHRAGVGIGVSVDLFLERRASVRHMLEELPPIGEEASPEGRRRYQEAVQTARSVLERSYQDFIDDAMGQDGEAD